MTGRWPVLLLAISSALAGPFAGGGPFGPGGGGPASSIVDGTIVVADFAEGAAATTDTAGVMKVRAGERIVFLNTLSSGPVAVTNIPAATTELPSTLYRRYADGTNYTSARLVVVQSGASVSGSKIGVQCSADAGSTWVFADGTADGDLAAEGPQITLATASSVHAPSAYQALGATCAGSVLWRAVTDDGDATADPGLVSLVLELR